MKRLFYILIPLLLLIGSAFSGSNITMGFLSKNSNIENNTYIGGDIVEVFSDDLMISRKAGQEKNTKFYPHTSSSLLDVFSDFYQQSQSVVLSYPFISLGKQAVCFGLLFLQQLF